MPIIIVILISFVAGFIIGFLATYFYIQKIIKKNFTIDENFINAFFAGIGHQQSKKQTRSILEKIKQLNKEK